MNTENLLYIFDAVMLVMFVRMLFVSKTVKIETQVGNKMKWLIPLLFTAVAIIGFMRYEGIFRWVQFIVPIVLGIMYYFMKSGLSDDGIVMSGTLIRFAKAGEITLSGKDSSIYFKRRGMTQAMFFDDDQFDDVRHFLKNHSVRSEYLQRL